MLKDQDMTPPADIPEKGFYYHYKHDPTGPLNNYAYELLDVGCLTEGDWSSADSYMAVYRPLYDESPAYKNGKLCFLRPLAMFLEDVTIEATGQPTPRFHKITNPEIIAELEKIKAQMYDSDDDA